MNTQRLLIVSILFGILLTACASSATPTQIAQYAPTSAPYPTQAPPPVAYPTAAPTQAPYATPAPTSPADMFFENYGVNPYVSAAADHLSTIVLDVDTASYTVARRYVMDGNLPPADAIRVEEFVNYFRQDYANPPEVAFGIYADGAPSPFLRDGSTLLRVGIQGYAVPEAERLPASLTFVIDISGSMSKENRLELVKRSLQLLVDRLRPDDTVAIVVFGSNARVVLNPASGEDRASILSAIYGLRAEGATNAEAVLRLGYQLANQGYLPGGINRVILCSDGVANVGATGPEAILESIRGYAEGGITLTTVGFGMGNFNDTLMEQLADKGDGHYAYVDTLDEARRLFVDDLTATLQVIALNAKVQVDFNPETVAAYRLVGYENRAVADQDFRNNAVDAGEIGAGHSATALYAVHFIPGAQGRIATVQLRWEDPQTHAVREINGNFNTWDLAPTFEAASLRYQLDAVVAQYAEVLRRSPWADDTTLSDLRVRAERLAAQLPQDPDVAEFAALVARASQLSGW
ncbi:MAG: von Willebrand factor type A domain-containing protein [Chloroflexi bacterium]|nr:von Willebrand factor type A domain-containing protein [Chloroflexota bacterium]